MTKCGIRRIIPMVENDDPDLSELEALDPKILESCTFEEGYFNPGGSDSEEDGDFNFAHDEAFQKAKTELAERFAKERNTDGRFHLEKLADQRDNRLYLFYIYA